MYIRVKRQKQTIFLYTDPSEKVSELKKKIAEINSVAANRIRLIFQDAPLDDDKAVGDLKIENDRVVFLVYKKEGTANLPLFYYHVFLCSASPFQAQKTGSPLMFTSQRLLNRMLSLRAIR